MSGEQKTTEQLVEVHHPKMKGGFSLELEEARTKREVLKVEKQYEKSKKLCVQNAIRILKPKECLKHVNVILDVGLVGQQFGVAILEQLQLNGIKYEVESQVQSNMITFRRTKIFIMETEPRKLAMDHKEVIEEDVLLYVPLMEFLSFVVNYHKKKQGLGHGICTLMNLAEENKRHVGNCCLTFLVQNIEEFYRIQKADASHDFRQSIKQTDEIIGNNGSGSKKRKKSNGGVAFSISRIEVDEALLWLQLETGMCVHFTESYAELARLVVQFAKSLAQRPFKQERMKTGGLNIFLEKSRGTRVLQDGTGLAIVWRQQLEQFRNVSIETANAIMAIYPSPRALINAYKLCGSQKEKDSLLEDIVVRRGTGVMATNRRVGKELSCKLLSFMTSTGENDVII